MQAGTGQYLAESRLDALRNNAITAKLHVFLSDNLRFDPTDDIPGESIGVYIRPDNPKRYWVDTSFLPKVAS